MNEEIINSILIGMGSNWKVLENRQEYLDIYNSSGEFIRCIPSCKDDENTAIIIRHMEYVSHEYYDRGVKAGRRDIKKKFYAIMDLDSP